MLGLFDFVDNNEKTPVTKCSSKMVETETEYKYRFLSNIALVYHPWRSEPGNSLVGNSFATMNFVFESMWQSISRQ